MSSWKEYDLEPTLENWRLYADEVAAEEYEGPQHCGECGYFSWGNFNDDDPCGNVGVCVAAAKEILKGGLCLGDAIRLATDTCSVIEEDENGVNIVCP